MKGFVLGVFLSASFALRGYAFVRAAPSPRNVSFCQRPDSRGIPGNNSPPYLKLRGGSDSFLKVTGADYSGAAKVLFGNIIGPASMLTGGLVPLGFLAEPLPYDKDGKSGKWVKKARCIYYALSVASLVNELIAIMYATVATNKLTEVAVEPAKSVFALIKRDYELAWMGTNVHFMLGLLGFCSMIMLRALTIYPKSLNTSSAGLALSALIGMISIVNVGVSEGDGQGHTLGGNLFSLLCRYICLLVKTSIAKRSLLGGISVILATYFGVQIIRNLRAPESQE